MLTLGPCLKYWNKKSGNLMLLFLASVNISSLKHLNKNNKRSHHSSDYMFIVCQQKRICSLAFMTILRCNIREMKRSNLLSGCYFLLLWYPNVISWNPHNIFVDVLNVLFYRVVLYDYFYLKHLYLVLYFLHFYILFLYFNLLKITVCY